MLKQIQDWFGISSQGQSMGLGHGPDDGRGHGHTHGSIDPTMATTTRGIWAIKWSFIVLAVTFGSLLAAGMPLVTAARCHPRRWILAMHEWNASMSVFYFRPRSIFSADFFC